MNMKQHILAALIEEFQHWEELLGIMSEEQLTARNCRPTGPSKMSSSICGPGSSVPSHGWKALCSIGNPSFPSGPAT